jgi:Family of unknown function (DUF6519)
MKADITRKTFRKEKHYDRVTMQQGRVQLDADWNEQADIRIYHSRITSRDVIGKNGAPIDDAGFEIQAKNNFSTKSSGGGGGNYIVGKGRYYVDGILCENENDVDATNQPDLPLFLICSWHDISSNDSYIKNHAIGRILDFLGAFIPKYKNTGWSDLNAVRVETKSNNKEKITIIRSQFSEDFISITLDNDDLTKATKAIVGFGKNHEEILELVIVKDAYDDDKIKLGYSPAIPFNNGKYIVYLDVWEREITWLDDRHLREVALGGVDTATRTKIVWQVKLLQVREDSDNENGHKYNKEFHQRQQEEQRYQAQEVRERVDDSSSSGSQPGYCSCESQYREWEELISEPKGTLKARLKPAYPPRDQCELPSEAAFHGPLHQLYRVEIHDGGTLKSGAIFKCSRDNGIVASKIAHIAGNENKITVENIGRDNSRFGYPIGSWIEVTDDRHELLGIPGTLAEVADVKGNVIFFRPDTIPKGEESITNENYPTMYNPKARRWDLIGTVEVPEENEGYIDLEYDIQIKFGESDGYTNGYSAIFRPGASWLIVARRADASKGIEWPVDKDGKPAALRAEGIKHHFTKLALLSVACLKEENENEGGKKVEEQRKSIEQQQEEQKYQREGKTDSSGHKYKYKYTIDDCRRFFLPLTSFEDYNTPKTGELTLDLRDSTKHEGGVYRNIKHHVKIKPRKNGPPPPPYVELGLVSLINDESSNVDTESATAHPGSAGTKVRFIRENSIPELPNRRLRLRAVNIGPETFDVSLDENTIKELGKKASQLRLRWWAIPCQEQEPQFV